MEGSGITNSFDITPLLFAIAGFSLILLVANYLGKSGSGKKLSTQVGAFIGFDNMSDARRQHKKEEAQRRELRKVKIFGIVAVLAFMILLISGVYLLGGMFELFETDADGIKLALSGLILGGICFVVFLYQWVQQKQHYDLLYGSVMDTRKK